jgi:hypothetical protein
MKHESKISYNKRDSIIESLLLVYSYGSIYLLLNVLLRNELFISETWRTTLLDDLKGIFVIIRALLYLNSKKSPKEKAAL